MVEHVFDHGVNHFDVAPTYGDAELKLGPKLRQHREDIFLGCKTQERSYEGAKRKLDRSFDRLGVDYIDLYQVHGLEYEPNWTRSPLTAARSLRYARRKTAGKIGHIGLTSHGNPGLIRDAIDRIDDLETVMFPLNPVVAGKDGDEYDYEAVLDRCEAEGIGTLGIKAFAKGSWPPTDELAEADRPYANWYEPVDTPEDIRERFDFAAARGLETVVSPGDPKLVRWCSTPRAVNGMDETAQRSLVERLRHDESPVPEQLHH